MTRQDIEKAIAYFKEPSTDCHTSDTLQAATRTLIQVAEAWLTLEVWLKEMNYGGGIIGKKIHELLNPKPKTDLQKVREWALQENHCTCCGNLLTFIDQLEKEKP